VLTGFSRSSYWAGAALVFRLLLSVLFIWSAWHKIQDPVSFQVKVNEYEILPVSWEEPFAYILPWVMVTSSGMLAAGILTRLAAATQAGMLAMFMVAIGVNVYRERVLGCGCFSEEGSPLGWDLLLLDAGLLSVAAALVIFGGGLISIDRAALFAFSRRGAGERASRDLSASGPPE